MKSREPYNRKVFLMPDDILSMACTHGKIILNDTRRDYQFRIHDCNHGIKLWGKLENEDDYKAGIEKMNALIIEANKMRQALIDEMDRYLNSIHEEFNDSDQSSE